MADYSSMTDKIEEIKGFYLDTAREYMRECNSWKEHILHDLKNDYLRNHQRALKNTLDEMEDVMKMVLSIENNKKGMV